MLNIRIYIQAQEEELVFGYSLLLLPSFKLLLLGVVRI
jgi:hypothetical protein